MFTIIRKDDLIGKVFFYTTVFGGYNSLNFLKKWNLEYEVLVITDKVPKIHYNNPLIKFWVVNYNNDFQLTNRMKAKYFKIMGLEYFTNLSYSIYFDANLYFKQNINSFIINNVYINFYDLIIFKHNKRSCTYDELFECVLSNRVDQNLLLNHLNFCISNKVKSNNGFYQGGFLIRKNSYDMICFMKIWWEEIQKFSERDQISLSYLINENSLNKLVLDENIFNSGFTYMLPNFIRDKDMILKFPIIVHNFKSLIIHIIFKFKLNAIFK